MKVALAAFLIVWTATNALAAPRNLSALDFVTEFRSLVGQTVTVKGCRIAGTTAEFIRCETANGAASFSLEALSMNKDDFRWALMTCPTGNRAKPACNVDVTGIVRTLKVPELSDAKIERNK